MKIFLCATLSLPLFCHAAPINLAEYSIPQETPGKIIHSFSFESGEKFRLAKADGISVAERAGMNGTGGLLITRTNPKRYDIASLSLPRLKGGKTYTVELSAKAEAVKKDGVACRGRIGFFAVEFYRNGKYTGGEYGGGTNENEWKRYQISFTVPEDAEAKLSFYLAKGLTGKVAVDDITVREAGGPSASVLLTSPENLTFRGGDTRYKILADTALPAENIAVHVSLDRKGTVSSQTAKRGSDGFYHGSFGKIKPGEATVTVRLLDIRKKQIIAEERFRCQSRPDTPLPPNTALLDKYGRLLVNGTPFMPLGVYGMSAKTRETDYKQIRDAGFNTLMLYVPEEKLGLDEAHKAGLKLIYSISVRWKNEWTRKEAARLVELNKNHPALLAWYISDEVSRDNVPKVLKLREAVSAIDPWHPTWTLTYRKQDFPYYGISGDIIGVDPYPIRAYGEDQNIRSVADYMEWANTTTLPCWVVPQIFNWNAYHNCNAEALKKTRFATKEEIRSMPLLAAIHGAKGFIFYSYFDLRKVDQFLPGSFEREWGKVKEMAAVMKELEPFIMSTAAAPKVKVKAFPENSVHAGAMSDENGNLRIIAVGLGGKTRAVITVRETRPLRSKYGLTKRIGPGKYEFTADKVNSDILY